MNIEELKTYCKLKGYTERKYRFKIIEEILGISPEEAKAVEQITRYIREIFPVDQYGIEKEAEYHKPLSQIIYEQEQSKFLKNKLL